MVSVAKSEAPYDASTRFFSMLDQVLSKAELNLENIDLIVASIGPGSFTGLRTGLSIVRGLSLAKNIPTLGIHSFEAFFSSIDLSHINTYRSFRIIIDAMRQEHYTLIFDKKGVILEAPRMIALDALQTDDTCLWVGNIDHMLVMRIDISLEAMAKYAYENLDKIGKLNPYYLNEPNFKCIQIAS